MIARRNQSHHQGGDDIGEGDWQGVGNCNPFLPFLDAGEIGFMPSVGFIEPDDRQNIIIRVGDQIGAKDTAPFLIFGHHQIGKGLIRIMVAQHKLVAIDIIFVDIEESGRVFYKPLIKSFEEIATMKQFRSRSLIQNFLVFFLLPPMLIAFVGAAGRQCVCPGASLVLVGTMTAGAGFLGKFRHCHSLHSAC
ncbi:hypothetical protein [Sphingopyxis sp. MWB1]|uniref:hypothetical protein n=1 Tax=Sphingopyxis sp. MWB1 TaxID=1537715 RepID=UPI0011869F9E|nr:hypothetical protein [Sphingopyxis sp. MWB1]